MLVLLRILHGWSCAAFRSAWASSKSSHFPLTGPHLPLLHSAITQMGHSNCSPPTPAPLVWLPHSCRLVPPLGLSVPCLGDMRCCCISVTFSPTKWGSNVPKPYPQPLAPFQHLLCAAFSHAGNPRRPRGHHLEFTPLLLLSGTLLPTWIYVIPCMGSNLHPQPWLHHSSWSCNVSFHFYTREQHFALEILETANMF